MKHSLLRRLGALALAAVLALSLAVPAWAADPVTPPTITGVTMRPQSVSLELTQTAELKAYTLYSNGTGVSSNNDFDWENSNPQVVKFEKQQDGTVRIEGINIGSATITATLQSDTSKTATCQVSVFLPSKVTAVKLDTYGPSNPLRLEVGKSETLKATVEPKTEDQTVTWSTGDSSVATVDATGRVTGVGKGNTTITATANADGLSKAECVVIVSEAVPTLTLSDTNLALEVGKSETLFAVNDNWPTGSWVRWTSSNPSAIQVSDGGVVTALRANIRVTITAALIGSDGRPVKGAGNRDLTATCSAVATDDTSVIITGITLNETSHSIPKTGTFQLTATVYPSNATDRTVLWRSSNENVATVKDGQVTAVSEGTASITATTLYGNRTATCVVTVSPATISLTPVAGAGVYNELSKKLYTFGRSSKSTATVTTTRLPADSLDPIQWQSKDASVVSASGTDTTGTLTRRSPGKTTVTAVPLGPDGKPREGVTPIELEVTVSGVSLQSTFTLEEYRRDSLTPTFFGDAADSNPACDEWRTSDPAVVTVDANGLLTARGKGTAVVTASKNGYEANCTVTVVEDASGIITLTGSHPSGSPVNMSTASATSTAGSGTLASVLDSISRAKTRTVNPDGTQTAGYGLQYITNLSVSSTDQGILHDQHHSTDDTGAGVGIQDIYYPGTAPQGQRSLSDLSFVPRTTFSGTAEISYTGRATNNTTFTGLIRIPVNGTGDVMYSSSEGSVVSFLASDFNHYHPNLRSVSFTPPLDSRGTLYYNYSSASQPGTKVTAGTRYYRSGTPSIDRVSFVPAQGFEGSVSIAYQGTDTNGRAISGTVRITVTNNKGGVSAPGDIYYPFREDSWTAFQSADFQRASQAVLGESLSYVRFTLPPSSEGTLFYNYRGFSNYDSAVASTTSYYYSGTPALSGVSFVPTTTSPSQVDIDYTGYTVRGNTFNGTIHIGQEDNTQQNNALRYTVFTGKSVYFNAYDFNTACVAATGASLNYVQFTQLPAVGQGALRYTRGTSTSYNNIATTTRCYRSSSNSWDVQLSNVSFLANSSYTGTVTIPFVGYNTNNSSFTGEVTIQVTPPTTGDSVFSGTTASPIRLSSSRMQALCSDALNGNLSYITFTSLPSTDAGRLYLNYNGFRTGTQVSTGTRYYASSTPSIDQISFVPRGRYSGQVSVGYTATDTSGRSASGLLTFNITSNGSSIYFSDLGGHRWAAPAVDYLYQNGVTNGVTPSTFGPEQRILRCDFVLMLCRAFGFGETGGYSFADVPTNAYYAGAVAAAKQRGIINGDGVNFMPNSELTRQDAMVMIYNAMKAANWGTSSASTSILGRFPDGASVSSYARDAVSTLVQMGAVSGDNGMLYPYDPITRAEAAVILHFVMTA